MIVGPSGCGKTTLLSVLCGTLGFDAGNIRVFGQDLGGMSDTQITAFRGRNVGFIFQQFNLIPTWNAVENANIPLLLADKTHGESESAVAKLLTEVGLGARLRAYPRQLSGGQQQRVTIACRPDRCVIVVTHDSRIFSFADRIAEFRVARSVNAQSGEMRGTESWVQSDCGDSPFASGRAREASGLSAHSL